MRVGAVGHEQDTIRQQDRLVHIVRDHEDGLLAFSPDLDQFILNHAARQRIEGAEGFVQQEQFRMRGKGARDAHALAHAARQFGRFAVQRVRQADHAEVARAVRARLLFRPGGPARPDPELNILQGREPRQQAVVLKHHAALKARADHFLAVHDDHPGGG